MASNLVGEFSLAEGEYGKTKTEGLSVSMQSSQSRKYITYIVSFLQSYQLQTVKYHDCIRFYNLL